MNLHHLLMLCLALFSAGLVSCASSNKEAAITKVNYYKLDATKAKNSADPAITFERKYYLYGAVSTEEIAARQGVYYRVHWSVKDKTTPVKLVLQYRQSLTAAVVHTKEITPDRIRGSNMTEMSVIGDEFKTNGHVTAWKISLMRGKEEIASHRSYLWE